MGLAHPKPSPNPDQAASRIAAIRRGQKSRQKMAAKPRPLFVPKGIPDVWAPLCKASRAPARVRVRVRLTLALALALALALSLTLSLTRGACSVERAQPCRASVGGGAKSR